MGTETSRNAILMRIGIVAILLAAIAGVLYAKHTRRTDPAAKTSAPRCPCSAHKPAAPGQ